MSELPLIYTSVSSHCCNCLWNCTSLFNAIISHADMRIWGVIKNMREGILFFCSLSWRRLNRFFLMHNRNSLIILKGSENRHKWCGPKLVLYLLKHNRHFKVWELHVTATCDFSHYLYKSVSKSNNNKACTDWDKSIIIFQSIIILSKNGLSVQAHIY